MASKSKGFAPPFGAGDRGWADVDDLKPFRLEDETYIQRDNDELVESIEQHGFREGEPLTVCLDGTILAGHRRRQAVKRLGEDRVPVLAVDVDPDSDEAVSIFLSSNHHREKTPGEVVNEGLAWESEPNLAQDEDGWTNERVARRLSIGKESYRKGKYVKENVGEIDGAREVWGDLLSGEDSIHGAYTRVKKSEEPDEPEQSDEPKPVPETVEADTEAMDEADRRVEEAREEARQQLEQLDESEPEGESIKDQSVETDVREPESPTEDSDESDDSEPETESETESEEPNDYEIAIQDALESLDHADENTSGGVNHMKMKAANRHINDAVRALEQVMS